MNLNSKIENQKRGGKDTTPLSDIKEYVEGGVKEYVALLTQTGTNAPVATVLKNTLGGIPIWTYSGVGDYVCTLTGVFTTGKTAISCQSTGGAQYGVPLISSLTLSNFTLSTFDLYAADFGDDVLTKALIKIEVYP